MRGDRIDVVSNPRAVGPLSEIMQGILGEPVRLSELGEGRRPFLFLRLWNGTRRLPGRVSTHAIQTRKRLTQQCIVQATRCLKVCRQAFGLPCITTKRQLQQERWCLASFHTAAPFPLLEQVYQNGNVASSPSWYTAVPISGTYAACIRLSAVVLVCFPLRPVVPQSTCPFVAPGGRPRPDRKSVV